MDSKMEGDNTKEAGVAKKKKEKFKEESVGYMDSKMEGDNTKEAGVAKKKRKKNLKNKQ